MARLALDLTEGITQYSSRMSLKMLFGQFGEVSACWVPPLEHRGKEPAYVKFQRTEAAQAAFDAIGTGQLYLDGVKLTCEWRMAPSKTQDSRDFDAKGSNFISSRDLARSLGAGRGDRGDRGGRGRSRKRSRSRSRGKKNKKKRRSRSRKRSKSRKRKKSSGSSSDSSSSSSSSKGEEAAQAQAQQPAPVAAAAPAAAAGGARKTAAAAGGGGADDPICLDSD
eukprot:TRINITY_DN2927_c2_g1_i1.p2 TRINITY_DN2927_c2_g1~~TRINITY_DN2927_c2_g1_i1.p2  ORF type:complete len:223 (-),score=72.71 TRINITY_DN2927_c2_g1_i1:39-707(-)